MRCNDLDDEPYQAPAIPHLIPCITNQNWFPVQKAVCLAPPFAIACTFPLPITNGILQNAAPRDARTERRATRSQSRFERERKVLAGAGTGTGNAK
jgi:hypothetical protein